MKGTTPKLHPFRGTWITAQQIADVTGIRVRTVHRRIQFGLPIEGPARFGPAPRRFQFRGHLATIPEMMLATGLSRSQVSKRTDGIRFYEKAELKDPNAPLPDSARKVFFGGITDSVSGWARRTGIPRHVISQRINMGWPIKRALTESVHHKRFHRNAKIIRKTLDAINSTGGYSTTSDHPEGTDAGRQARDLQSEMRAFR